MAIKYKEGDKFVFRIEKVEEKSSGGASLGIPSSHLGTSSR